MKPERMAAGAKRRRTPPKTVDPVLERLWGEGPPSGRGPKPALTLERILTAAIDLATAEGLGEVSMRRVALQLGFTTMSLYRHVRSKDELADLMLDAAVGPPPDLQAVAGGWRARLERWARAEWAFLQKYPWALQLIAARASLGPNRMAWLEAALRALADTDLPGHDRLEVVRLVDRYVRGAAQDPTMPAGDAGAQQAWLAAQQRLLERLSNDARYQTLARVLTSATSQHTPDDLGFGLQRLLDGVETLVRAAARKKGKR
jgi:AcrR family transcriptional regulator